MQVDASSTRAYGGMGIGLSLVQKTDCRIKAKNRLSHFVHDKTYEKVVSNIEEVRARGAAVIALTTQGDRHLASKCRDMIFIPKAPWYINPVLLAVPLQLLAYHIADHKGTDVDQPRNLAKSVTVE